MSQQWSPTRGSVSVEVAILTPVLLLLIILATMVGRTAVAHNAVTVAAHDAARAASLSRDADSANENAQAAAAEALQQQGLACQQIDIDTTDLATQFATPVGSPAAVTVIVGCEVDFVDISILGMSTSHWVQAQFTSPLDTWRGRP